MLLCAVCDDRKVSSLCQPPIRCTFEVIGQERKRYCLSIEMMADTHHPEHIQAAPRRSSWPSLPAKAHIIVGYREGL